MSDIKAISASVLTFAILTALALPHLETGLTFIPIFAISVLVGLLVFVTSKALYKKKNSN